MKHQPLRDELGERKAHIDQARTVPPGDIGHLKGDLAAEAHDLRADPDELLSQALDLVVKRIMARLPGYCQEELASSGN